LAFNFSFAAVAATGVRVARGLTNSEIKPSFIEQKLGFIH
jgi:hypothetical protein